MIAVRDGICKVNRFRLPILFLTTISVTVMDGSEFVEQLIATLAFGLLFLVIILVALLCIENDCFRKMLKKIRKRSWE